MFIELNQVKDHNKILINMKNVVSIRPHISEGSLIETTEGILLVKESYDEIKSKLSVPLSV